MLVYNDQNEFVNKRNEKTYLTLIPEDNLWVKLNREVDFLTLGKYLKETFAMENYESMEEVIRLFKYLLLKAYYHLSDNDLVLKTKTDITFRYFLDYDPMDMDLVNVSVLQRFRRQEISFENKKYIGALLGLEEGNSDEDLLTIIKREVGYIDGVHKNLDDMTLEEVKAYCDDRLASIYRLEGKKSEEINSKMKYLQEIISDINAMNRDGVKYTLQTIAATFIIDKIKSS